jgi:hypothetical protein
VSDIGFYTILGGLLLAAIGIAYAWKKGLFGLATETRIKTKIIPALKDDAEAIIDEAEHWEQVLKDKIAARKAKEAAAKDAATPSPPTLTDVVAKNRLDSIAAAFDMYKNNALTKEEYEEIKAGYFQKKDHA